MTTHTPGHLGSYALLAHQNQPKRKSFFDRCQPLLPVFTVLVSGLGCTWTIWHEAHTTRSEVQQAHDQMTLAREQTTLAQRQMDQAQEEFNEGKWVEALEKINFEEQNLMSTALLMRQFEAVPQYREDARRVERAVLEQTRRPEVFDTLVSDMVDKADEPEQVSDLTEVIRYLNLRLDEACSEAMNHRACADGDFRSFLANPAKLYPSSQQQSKLDNVLATMWELDSLSGKLSCAFDLTNSRCSHPAGLQKETVEKTRLLNASWREMPAAFTTVRSCEVDRDVSGAHFICSRRPEMGT